MINGCDGCLNPSQFELESPHNNTKGTHNGLEPIVKHLEKIFTNPEYPNGRNSAYTILEIGIAHTAEIGIAHTVQRKHTIHTIIL